MGHGRASLLLPLPNYYPAVMPVTGIGSNPFVLLPGGNIRDRFPL
jgi:hypothetical protein